MFFAKARSDHNLSLIVTLYQFDQIGKTRVSNPAVRIVSYPGITSWEITRIVPQDDTSKRIVLIASEIRTPQSRFKSTSHFDRFTG